MSVVFFGYLIVGLLSGFGLHFGLDVSAEWAALSGAIIFLSLGQIHLFTFQKTQQVEDLEELLYETRKSVKKIDQKLEVVDARSSVLEDTFKAELDERLDRLVSERKALDLAAAGHTSAQREQTPQYTSVGADEAVWQEAQPADTPTSSRSLRSRFMEFELETNEQTTQAPPLERAMPLVEAENKSNDSPLNHAVRDAILSGRVNLQLQKIVSLPHRQVKFYECFSRPQEHEDTIILPRAFIDTVRNGGMGPALDAQTLYRTLAIQRKLASSDRRVGLFCNIMAPSLLENQSLSGLVAQVGDDKEIARALIFEINYLEFLQHEDMLLPRMRQLTDLGIRFSLDNVPSLGVDCDQLVQFGVRFLKMGVDVLMEQIRLPESRPICFGERSRCGPTSLTDVFARQGISLIVDRVEQESQVAQLLDWQIGLAQGYVFAPPKALKPEIFKATQPDEAFMRGLAYL